MPKELKVVCVLMGLVLITGAAWRAHVNVPHTDCPITDPSLPVADFLTQQDKFMDCIDHQMDVTDQNMSNTLLIQLFDIVGVLFVGLGFIVFEATTDWRRHKAYLLRRKLQRHV